MEDDIQKAPVGVFEKRHICDLTPLHTSHIHIILRVERSFLSLCKRFSSLFVYASDTLHAIHQFTILAFIRDFFESILHVQLRMTAATHLVPDFRH